MAFLYGQEEKVFLEGN